ncbi:glycosyltransferase [Celeribacter litoreus]|uniref:glycosyltransferase n=1 Tax=Celeribacter litoreus TaxID=2876714 RepID=UPI001CCA6433|nr:glycosyltransferase [Celeribacter litoreus]MCA0044211.1 glycosyltransferase [Celeribacter litoreus]
MTAKLRIIHLVDDTTPGGLMRVIDLMTNSPELTQMAQQMVRIVGRGEALPQCDADVVISHLTINWRSLPRLIAFRARHSGVQLYHVEHSYTEGFTAHNVPFKARFFTLLRTAYALFDRVIAVSSAQADWLRRRGLVRSTRLTVIRSRVSLDPFFDLPAPEGPVRVLGAIGRLDRQKGFDVLIKAFRTLPDPDLRLHVYGSGSEETALKALAHGDTRIRFFGYVSDPVEAMAAVDLVVMPSRWESFGLVALEARAARRPLLYADVDGLHESGAGAAFVKGHDPEVWALALENQIYGKARCVPASPKQQDIGLDWSTLLQSLTLDKGRPGLQQSAA